MNVLGINKGATVYGKILKDGACSVARDGKLVAAVPEERICRTKHSGGFAHSLKAIVRDQGLSLSDFDLIVASTCCEEESNSLIGHELEGHPNLITLNHHLSHAYHAFIQSGFERSLVAIIDGGGNTFSDNQTGKWWAVQREQHSYYVAEGNSISLLDRDFFEPYECGFGEIYRAFSYYLGFPSGQLASRTMALAGFGNRERFKHKPFFEIRDNHLVSPIINNPKEPNEVVSSLLDTVGIYCVESRKPGEEYLQIHKDLASYVQTCVEEGVLEKFRILIRQTGIKNICLGGGFFLNCVCNGRIARERLFDSIYVSASPGDTGQAVGNAIFGSLAKRRINHFVARLSSDAAIGLKRENITYGTISNALSQNSLSGAVVIPLDSPGTWVAQLLAQGNSVAVFNGCSEYGPRALGQRSILSDPRSVFNKGYLNNLKNRDWFMPFAPIILREWADDFLGTPVDSPFMSFAISTKTDATTLIPAVMSNDGTSRFQTVCAEDDSLTRQILTKFKEITGIPIILNTSFNLAGQPIVETPEEAIETFSHMNINALLIDKYLVLKSLYPELISLGLISQTYNIPISIRIQGEDLEYKGKSNVLDIVHWLHGITQSSIYIRPQLPLFKDFHRWLKLKRKTTTIRFRQFSVELPCALEISLKETNDFGKPDKISNQEEVTIVGIKYSKFGGLTEEDAIRDGFENLDQLRDVFKKDIYSNIQDDDWVTVYSVLEKQATF